VGTGTSASCTESALDARLPGGAGFNGAVTFDCGADPVTITITSTKMIAADTTIDGGGRITLSGGGGFFCCERRSDPKPSRRNHQRAVAVIIQAVNNTLRCRGESMMSRRCAMA
jgi:hypothetical protein